MPSVPEYQPQTIVETLEQIVNGRDPWLAIGQFVDDWKRTPLDQRSELVAEPLLEVEEPHLRWAALLAASVEWLCYRDGLPFPGWTGRSIYRLAEPWFLYPGLRLRAWQLFETPVPFKMRNIFGGDRILDRV